MSTVITIPIMRLRSEYRKLDIFDQVRVHAEIKAICKSQNIDMFLLTCTDEYFNDLAVEQDKIFREVSPQNGIVLPYKNEKLL